MDCRRADFISRLFPSLSIVQIGLQIYHLFFVSPKFLLLLRRYNTSVMDVFFNYSGQVSGKDFIGRKMELNAMTNLILSGENIALYGEPKTGKRSLIFQAFTRLGLSGRQMVVVKIDFMRARTTADILETYASNIIRNCAAQVSDYEDMFNSYLSGGNMVFDREAADDGRDFLHFSNAPDKGDIELVLSFPFRFSKDRGQQTVLFLDEFQNFSESEDDYHLFKCLERLLEDMDRSCSMIFSGSRFNAMKDIFEVKRYLWNDVELFPLSQFSPADITDYVQKGFQYRGKVIDKSLIFDVSEMMRYNMWYINHLFSIVDRTAVGYINQMYVNEAMKNLMAIHRDRFFAQMTDLTDFQIHLLKAVMDGETRFSTAGVIEKYKLNSSANVKRLKDALLKKEVLWFDENDVPHVQDILFEIWLREEYFGKTGK